MSFILSVLFIGGFLVLIIRQAHVISKNNSGKLRCQGLIGRLLEHKFVEHYGDRTCSICGLVQKEGPAGILIRDGDTWYDKGYAENKETLIQHYLDQKRTEDEKYRKWDENRRINTINTIIPTPNIHKVTNKEDSQ